MAAGIVDLSRTLDGGSRGHMVGSREQVSGTEVGTEGGLRSHTSEVRVKSFPILNAPYQRMGKAAVSGSELHERRAYQNTHLRWPARSC